jgi:thermitase
VKKTVVVLAIAILLISSFPTIVFAAPPDNPASVSDLSSSQQILVKFRPGTGLPEAAQIHRQLGGQVKGTIAGIGVQVVTVPKGQAKEKAKAYSARYGVAYAEADYMAEALAEPDDSYFTAQWNMQKVGAPGAWDITTGSPNVTIAILDTGVDLDHPDLAGKIVDNRNFTTSNTTDDIYGHGTHVAGIAAAITNNGLGVAGLGYASSIMNIKVLGDDGMGYWSWIAQGIIWAADNDAQIINLSLGGSDGSSTLEDAINYAWSKGVVVVAAAGNNGNTVPVYPAYYANCIAVAATDASDARPLWSNYGDWVDVAAPGYRILSTSKNDNYVYMSGTSMATPHVAGLAALLFTTVSDTNGNGKLNDEVRSWMEASCDDVGVSGIGHGRVNAVRAVGSVPVLPGKISGQVTNAGDGLPVVGATVTDGTRTVLTDSAGQYTISDVPPGTYQVVASKNGYESSALPVTVLAGTTTVASFTLNEVIVPGSISGAVVSAKDGSPLIGATVTDGTRTTTTDATGKYTITNVPADTYQVTASNSGYYSSSSTVTVVSGGNAVANFSLSRIPGSITGSVTDAKDGLPIVGATVSDATRTTTTDATGKYTISDVPPGTYEVVASKEGYESLSLTVSVLSGTNSGATAVANFCLSQIIVPGSISGTVTNAKDGTPIVGVTVTDGTRVTSGDATGKYAIADVPLGTYQVTASKAGYYSSSVTVNVLSGATAVVNLSLSQIPGSISGSVTDAKDGSPIVGAVVTDGTRTTTTDATGKYTITNVPADTYQVTASNSGYYSSSSTVTVVSVGNAIANFSLSQIPGSITGSVTDAKDGSPIVGAMVADGARTATTDASGKYTIVNVPPGTYQVTVSKSGYYSSSLTATVVSGTITVANFSLSQIPGNITGSVTNAKDGSAIVGAVVTDGTRTATTDASGKYTIVDVPPGTYQVTVSKSGYYSSSLTATVVSGTITVANFPLSQIPGSITGSVTNAKDGSPIVGAAVTDGTRTATTNASGKYTIADVPSGTYQVVASKVGYQSLTTSVAVVSGATSVKDFSLNQDPPAANAMWVDSIQFTKNGNNLVIEVKVVTASGVLPRAKVVLSLKCSNGRIWRLSGTTGTTGVVRFWVSRAPVGSYLSTVTSLTRSGFTWDRNRGITSASYALSLYLSQSKWGIGRGTVSQNLWHL